MFVCTLYISKIEESIDFEKTLWFPYHTLIFHKIHLINLEIDNTCVDKIGIINVCWVQFINYEKTSKFNEFSIHLNFIKCCIWPTFEHNHKNTQSCTLTLLKFHKNHKLLSALSFQYLLLFFVQLRNRYRNIHGAKTKSFAKQSRSLDIVLLSIGCYLKGVVCFWIFDVFISSSGFISQLYFGDFVMNFFVVAITLSCTHTHAHTVRPIVSICLFLLDYYDYYNIKFSNQLEQCCVRTAYVSVCMRQNGREGRRRPYTQIDLLHFAIKIPIHKKEKHAIRKYKSIDP